MIGYSTYSRASSLKLIFFLLQDKKKKRKRMSVSETESSDGPEDYDVESDWSVACLTEQVPISTYPLMIST